MSFVVISIIPTHTLDTSVSHVLKSMLFVHVVGTSIFIKVVELRKTFIRILRNRRAPIEVAHDLIKLLLTDEKFTLRTLAP